MTMLLGRKIGMTQVFRDNGAVVPVTVIEISEGVVVDKKTEEKEGYNALRIGFFDIKKPKNVSKPIKGIYKNEKTKKDLPLKKELKEIRVDKKDLDNYNVGDVITFEALGDLKFVDVTGTSRGKGTQGVMKRHGFGGGPGGHGSNHHRKPGSIGASSYPSRVFKGHKMGGRMGDERVTVMNLAVEKIDLKNRFVLIKGAVPGGENSTVEVRKAKKKN
ncbi:MAG: 50S ribosomal protein L3 [Candidatus Goldiibacteriota bacterium]